MPFYNILRQKNVQIKSIILQSNTQLQMNSPGHIGQSVVQATIFTSNIPQAPDAVWIWGKGWNAPNCVNPLIIQQDFIVQFNNPITFYVIADNHFTLQLKFSVELIGQRYFEKNSLSVVVKDIDLRLLLLILFLVILPAQYMPSYKLLHNQIFQTFIDPISSLVSIKLITLNPIFY